jgi:hypothetical protein
MGKNAEPHRNFLNSLLGWAAPCYTPGRMDLLAQARAERDRWTKIVELLEASPSPAATTKSKKNSPTSKSYWTPARRKAMSDKIKALQKKKPQAAKKA